MATRKCGRGKIYRKSYTRRGRRGRRVAGRCIRSPPVVRHVSLRCGRGFIKRASYTRRLRSGRKTIVRERCIRDVGAPGKGLRGTTRPGIGRLRSGELAKYGYVHVVNMKPAARRAALSAAVAAYGSLSVWRKLNAVHVYTRRLSPASSAIFKEDMDWIRGKYL